MAMPPCRKIEKCTFYSYFKCLHIVMEGTVSHIFYIGPSFYFMKCIKLSFKKYQKVSRYLSYLLKTDG